MLLTYIVCCNVFLTFFVQCCQEEKDELCMQKERCDQDLEKLEHCLHDVITKFDLEARQRHGNFQHSYAHLGPEAQQVCYNILLMQQ